MVCFAASLCNAASPFIAIYVSMALAFHQPGISVSILALVSPIAIQESWGSPLPKCCPTMCSTMGMDRPDALFAANSKMKFSGMSQNSRLRNAQIDSTNVNAMRKTMTVPLTIMASALTAKQVVVHPIAAA